jgi:dipeptidase
MAVRTPRAIQATVSASTLAAADQLAQEKGVTRSELVRHALEVYKLLHDSVDDGAEILIKKGKDVQRIARI